LKPEPYSFRRCDLTGCELRAEFQLADGRHLCGRHAGLFYAGATVVQRHNEANEEDLVSQLVDDQLELERERMKGEEE
jgi:hypothetical protein